MFDDIEQLEKEIETFRKNIIASSELLDELDKLTKATKQHKEYYVQTTENLIRKIDESVDIVKKEYDAALERLHSENSNAIEGLKQTTISEQRLTSNRIAEKSEGYVKKIVSSNDASMEELRKCIATEENLIKKIDESIDLVKKEYNAALERLCSENRNSLEGLKQTTITEQRLSSNKISEKTEEAIKKLISSNDASIEDLRKHITAEHEKNIKELDSRIQVINQYQKDIEKKYEDFSNCISDTNIGQMKSEMDALKKSLNAKFMILFGFSGLIVILSIIGLFVK